jgi:hypothetical protein
LRAGEKGSRGTPCPCPNDQIYFFVFEIVLVWNNCIFLNNLK